MKSISPQEKRWMTLQTKVFEEKIKAAFGLFREHKLEPILIKGWAAAQFYPDRNERLYTDIDLCVRPQDFAAARAVLETVRAESLSIDLHAGLRHLDSTPWENLYANSILKDLDGTPIRLLRPEDHLRVLCAHWLNDGGVSRDKLRDVYFAVANRPADFDWERCLSTVDRNRREWVIKTIAVARRYLDLETGDLPFAAELDELPKWLTRTIEREWASPVTLTPLFLAVRSKRKFWQQIRKRFPPNALQATIEMNGALDGKPRIYYQIGSFVHRLKPSAKSFGRFLRAKLSKERRRNER